MTAKQKVVKLPEKPSALIRLALRDLEKVERSKKYVVDMGQWHTPNANGDGKCAVCFAGAIMARTLKSDPAVDFISLIWDDSTDQKMDALNCFRDGDISGAFDYLRREAPEALPGSVSIAAYVPGRRAFKRDMTKLATLLAKHGC